jgi:hypothetical protein
MNMSGDCWHGEYTAPSSPLLLSHPPFTNPFLDVPIKSLLWKGRGTNADSQHTDRSNEGLYGTDVLAFNVRKGHCEHEVTARAIMEHSGISGPAQTIVKVLGLYCRVGHMDR